MRGSGLRLALVGLTALFLITPVFADDVAASELDWSQYDGIDPLDPAAGEFLATDLALLERQASAEYQAGDYLQSARLYLALLQHDGGNTSALYNLACDYGLLGEAQLAALYLDHAVAAGFTDAERVQSDPDFDSVRESAAFQAVVAGLAEAAAERESQLGELINVESTAFFKCRVKLPADYDPSRAYPLVVGLHGHGHWPDGFIKVWERFDDPQFIFVAPQGPYPIDNDPEIGYSWITWSETDQHLWRASTNLALSYVRDVVETVRSRYYVDDVYLLGFSQGCMLTYKAGLMDPELFRGLICFGGWLDEEFIPVSELEAARGLRVFIAHGNQDPVVEFAAGQKAFELLQGLGYDVTFFEFDGAHQVPEEACRAAQAWMLDAPEPVADATTAAQSAATAGD